MMCKRKNRNRADRRIRMAAPALLLALALVMPGAAETANAAEQTQTEVQVTAPEKVQIRSAKVTVRGYITLKWRTCEDVSGYVIDRSVNGGSYKKVKTVKNASAVKWTDKNTESGKTYRYRIRAYKESDQGDIYGNYSKVKKVKISRLQYQRVTDIEKLDAAEDTDKLIIVNASGVNSSVAVLQYFKKTNGKWKEVLRADARVGKNGINKKKEGDYRTPTGAFYFTKLFGIKSDPGTIMSYTKLTYSMYWCASAKKYYNLFVNDAVNSGHRDTCSHSKDEQLAAFGSIYNYCAAIGYNTGRSWNKGSAIFLHCTRSSGSPTSTAGCVAVDENSMKKLMRQIDQKTMIVIDRYDRIRKY